MNQYGKTLAGVTAVALFLAICGGSAFATSYYAVANDNNPSGNTISVYVVQGTALSHVTTVSTGGTGTGGGYFADALQGIVADGPATCVYAGDGGSSDIAAMSVISTSPYLHLVANYVSPDGDIGSNGLGVRLSNGYLYANYGGNIPFGGSAQPSIGVWKVGSGCTLTFVTHVANAVGINGGNIDGMAITPNGNTLVVAYGDGSVGSYAIGGGNISLIGQELISGASVGSGASAGSVAISANGKWAIFGDFSLSNNTQLDIASIGANGALSATTTYGGTGALGPGVDSNGIQLSPDNRFLYAADTESGQVTTLSFNASTGVPTYNGCITTLYGFNVNWSFNPQVAVAAPVAAGGGLYVSESFPPSGALFQSYIGLLQINNSTGCTTEAPNSPFADASFAALESITAYSH